MFNSSSYIRNMKALSAIANQSGEVSALTAYSLEIHGFITNKDGQYSLTFTGQMRLAESQMSEADKAQTLAAVRRDLAEAEQRLERAKAVDTYSWTDTSKAAQEARRDVTEAAEAARFVQYHVDSLLHPPVQL